MGLYHPYWSGADWVLTPRFLAVDDPQRGLLYLVLVSEGEAEAWDWQQALVFFGFLCCD